MIENPFKSMRIKSYHSYILVLGGFLLIISLFYEPKIISQQKLVGLCIITIIYGLIAWIMEKQYPEKAKQLELDWMRFYESQPMRGIEAMNDSGYEAKLLKKFLKENNSENMLSKYHRNTWVFLIIYLLIMVSIYLI